MANGPINLKQLWEWIDEMSIWELRQAMENAIPAWVLLPFVLGFVVLILVALFVLVRNRWS